jgi:hypothetical protein
VPIVLACKEVTAPFAVSSSGSGGGTSPKAQRSGGAYPATHLIRTLHSAPGKKKLDGRDAVGRAHQPGLSAAQASQADFQTKESRIPTSIK